MLTSFDKIYLDFIKNILYNYIRMSVRLRSHAILLKFNSIYIDYEKVIRRRCKLNPILAIVLIVAALAIGLALGFILRKIGAEKKIGSAEEQAKKILEDAIKNAENAKKESIISAKDEIFQLKKEADRDINERRKEVSRQERRNIQKEETTHHG